jgi:hypothetical protein
MWVHLANPPRATAKPEKGDLAGVQFLVVRRSGAKGVAR